MESVGKHLDELAEVDTLIGYIIENSLIAVALILHITNLHLQAKVLGYLSALNHCAVLTALSLVILVHIHRLGNAVDPLYVVSRLKVGLLQLQFNESSGKCHGTDVMSRTCFNSHYITLA